MFSFRFIFPSQYKNRDFPSDFTFTTNMRKENIIKKNPVFDNKYLLHSLIAFELFYAT